ncbi:hypothetical protein [Chelatococcus asaccharovorans]|uniref:Uncharacterized protein n=1 Tax=Chelatococcus asaccharovorans TaxID=28210 RepID=A0A2V3TUT7_9HYPH|nr:hypothetical protein [Chelatococcus asaccharovorans]MBS7706072.1 hypothetical protein [Chelatococcus asaccharovorans]PXW52441.1 hypothetical protein C7450_11614 [Chelatococcus asaccharovorans]CAH1659859.1 conserved hypothetical protein [Chelatococcus asaccharovorans]CAH1684033.1 conserved hypothetical protein [Chelatococcus asaccharovorans]
MVGITLSPEQIRSAPPEVRHWLEQEIATSLGFRPDDDVARLGSEHLVDLTPQEAMAVYDSVRGMFSVANAFFELGQPAMVLGQGHICAHPLLQMLRHTRLQSLDQLIACLQAIDDVVRRLRADPHATVYVLDKRGYCLTTDLTRTSIGQVWSELIGGRGSRERSGPTREEPVMPPSSDFSLSQTLPANALHFGEDIAPHDPKTATPPPADPSDAALRQP